MYKRCVAVGHVADLCVREQAVHAESEHFIQLCVIQPLRYRYVWIHLNVWGGLCQRNEQIPTMDIKVLGTQNVSGGRLYDR